MLSISMTNIHLAVKKLTTLSYRSHKTAEEVCGGINPLGTLANPDDRKTVVQLNSKRPDGRIGPIYGKWDGHFSQKSNMSKFRGWMAIVFSLRPCEYAIELTCRVAVVAAQSVTAVRAQHCLTLLRMEMNGPFPNARQLQRQNIFGLFSFLQHLNNVVKWCSS